MFNIREAINTDKPKAYKKENLSPVEFEPEAHLLQRRNPKIEKHPVEDTNVGHRERLRKRFEKAKFDGFNVYEVLEFFLTYAIPRKDTKVISKNLLKRFGSLKGILSTDIKELEQVDGLGRQSAIFIKALSEFIKLYFEDQVERNEIQFTTLDQMVKYLEAVIGSYKNEVVKVIYLNSQNKLVHKELVSEGTVNESILNIRNIVAAALKYESTSVIVAHNHPSGDPEPSGYDDKITIKIAEALKIVDIDLQDHLIIASEGFYSYRQQGILLTP